MLLLVANLEQQTKHVENLFVKLLQYVLHIWQHMDLLKQIPLHGFLSSLPVHDEFHVVGKFRFLVVVG